MDQCCQDKSSELAVLRAQQGRVLQIALGINLLWAAGRDWRHAAA